MKVNTLTRYEFNGLLLDFNVDEVSLNKIYFPWGRVNFTWANDPESPRTVLLTAQPLKVDMMLSDVRDKFGRDFMGGASFIVRKIEAVIDVFGQVNGYRNLCVMSTAPEFEDIYGETE